jgi:hypothetical protein
VFPAAIIAKSTLTLSAGAARLTGQSGPSGPDDLGGGAPRLGTPPTLNGEPLRSLSATAADAIPSVMPCSLRFTRPCQPTLRRSPPTGAQWLHEVKFDGWRIQAHKDRNNIALTPKTAMTSCRSFEA